MIDWETLMSQTLLDYLGSPIYAGLLVILFFVVWAVFMRARLEASLVFIIPAFILASTLIPGLNLLIALGLGIIFGFALLRLGVR